MSIQECGLTFETQERVEIRLGQKLTQTRVGCSVEGLDAKSSKKLEKKRSLRF
jgi:hypothetical protein